MRRQGAAALRAGEGGRQRRRCRVGEPAEQGALHQGGCRLLGLERATARLIAHLILAGGIGQRALGDRTFAN